MINIPYVKGVTSKQAHVGIPDGTYEEEYARNGFFGGYAHLYRTEPPTAWTRIEGPLKPRAFAPRALAEGDFLACRKPYLFNEDCRIHFFAQTRAMPYHFRNADMDEVYFIHQGAGLLETDFGPVQYEAGDYLLIPRGTVYRFEPAQPTQLLLVESAGEYRFPDKGMLGEHALFDPSVIRVPTPRATCPSVGSAAAPSAREWELKIQRRGAITSVFYPFDPINVVGWKGTLSVMQLNVRDIRPVSCDRYHLPPSAHTTFVGHNFVICSFLPRPLENGDPEAMKVPFYHSNIDFDEVLFYHAGQFFSREGIGPGMLTFHPQGIHHGPQPQAVERTRSVRETQEIAVMIDTKKPLEVGPAALPSEIADYWMSWRKK